MELKKNEAFHQICDISEYGVHQIDKHTLLIFGGQDNKNFDPTTNCFYMHTSGDTVEV